MLQHGSRRVTFILGAGGEHGNEANTLRERRESPEGGTITPERCRPERAGALIHPRALSAPQALHVRAALYSTASTVSDAVVSIPR